MDRLKESQFAKLLYEYVDTYVKYKVANDDEKFMISLLLSDESKELFLYFGKLQNDNDTLQSRIAELEAENDQLAAHYATERQDDKWIPVSERLPDNWMSVLTIDRSKSTRDMMTAFYNPETSLWSTHFSCDLWVTHWMPLPEPPIMYGKEREE